MQERSRERMGDMGGARMTSFSEIKRRFCVDVVQMQQEYRKRVNGEDRQRWIKWFLLLKGRRLMNVHAERAVG